MSTTHLLRLRLSLILLGVTLAALAVVGTAASRLIERAMLRHAETRVVEENRLIRDMVAAYYQGLVRSVSDLSVSFRHRFAGPFSIARDGEPLPRLYSAGLLLSGRTDEVDRFAYDTRGHGAAVMVAGPDGLRTVSSSLRRENGDRDLSLVFGPRDPVYQRLALGQPVTGHLWLGRRHHMMHLEPLRGRDGAMVGALVVAMDMAEALQSIKAMIRSVRIGETGYAYVLDARPGNEGTLLVHPAQEMANILDARDADGRAFVRDMFAKGDGVIRYPWRNPSLGEAAAREKIVAFNRVPELQWIIGSGSYLDELTSVADEVRRAILWGGVLFALLLMIVLNLAIGRWVLRPLIELQRRLRESEERWSFAVEGSGDGIWDWRLDQGRIYYSDRWRALLGCPDADAEAAPAQRDALIHPDDLPAVRQRLAEHLRGEADHYVSEHRMRRGDGEYLWVLERGKVVSTAADGSARRLIGTLTDITARKRAEEERMLWANIFADSTEGIAITDPELRILSANRAFETITGHAAESLRERTPLGLQADPCDEVTLSVVGEALARDGRWQGELNLRRQNGQTYIGSLFLTTVRDAAERVLYRVAILSDISERKAAEAQVEFLSHHDVLTGLGNRGYLRGRLEGLLSGAEGPPLALVAIGIDRLKDVNESLGHQAGDLVLKTIADRLRGRLRAVDVLTRINGDEFVVVLQEPGGADRIMRIVRELLAAIGEPCLAGSMELRMTASAGVSCCPGDGRDAEHLVRNAEAAMHSAKGQGRGQVRFFTQDLNERAAARLVMENQLRQAVDNAELHLMYQPQIDLRSGRLVGVEALLRWHPQSGPVSPAQFIPLAEETQLIVPIGEWVLREACRQQQAWRAAGHGCIPVAVNISAVQFRQPSFVRLVERAIADYGVPAGGLELEVTESLMMHDAAQAAELFGQLKALGVGLAIDDFGTGYSSMSYLRHFPLDRLKIDQSFVRGAGDGLAEDAIVRTIIALAENLQLRVIAEGVETLEQAERLRQHGCQEVQGYLFGKPMLPNDLLDWYGEHHGAAAPAS